MRSSKSDSRGAAGDHSRDVASRRLCSGATGDRGQMLHDDEVATIVTTIPFGFGSSTERHDAD